MRLVRAIWLRDWADDGLRSPAEERRGSFDIDRQRFSDASDLGASERAPSCCFPRARRGIPSEETSSTSGKTFCLRAISSRISSRRFLWDGEPTRYHREVTLFRPPSPKPIVQLLLQWAFQHHLLRETDIGFRLIGLP